MTRSAVHRHVGRCVDTIPLEIRLGIGELRFHKEDAAVTVGLDTPFLFNSKIHLVGSRENRNEREGGRCLITLLGINPIQPAASLVSYESILHCEHVGMCLPQK